MRGLLNSHAVTASGVSPVRVVSDWQILRILNRCSDVIFFVSS